MGGRPTVFSESADGHIRVVHGEGGYHLWRSGSKPQPLPGWHSHRLSPGGSLIAYLESPSGVVTDANFNRVSAKVELRVADTPTLTPRFVADLGPLSSERTYPLAWSPSGRYLVFSATHIYDATEDRVVSLGGVFQSWAPGEDTIVFGRGSAVWIRDMPAAREQLVRGYGGGVYGYPRFVSNTELVIRPGDDYLKSITQIELVDLNTMQGNVWDTTDSSIVGRKGDRLLLSNLKNPACTTVALLGMNRQIIQCLRGDSGVWSPNGTQIATVEGANCRQLASSVNIWITVVGGSALKLAEIDASVASTTWSADGTYILVQKQPCARD